MALASPPSILLAGVFRRSPLVADCFFLRARAALCLAPSGMDVVSKLLADFARPDGLVIGPVNNISLPRQ